MKVVYQVWAKYRYHRIGHDQWSMVAMHDDADEAKAIADRFLADGNVSEVKIIVAQELA